LIRKDLYKFIKYAKQAGIIDIYLSTNGSLLDEKNSKLLIESGLMRLQVSIDAHTEETFNKMRQGGNFEQIKKYIR
jgi:molybdenum cofactor biosynthesis enzyme MoaA